MITREAWYREANERDLSRLRKLLLKGDAEAARQFWKGASRAGFPEGLITQRVVFATPDEVLQEYLPSELYETSISWYAPDEQEVEDWRADSSWEIFDEPDYELVTSEHPLKHLLRRFSEGGWKWSEGGGTEFVKEGTVPLWDEDGHGYWREDQVLRVDEQGPVSELAWRLK